MAQHAQPSPNAAAAPLIESDLRALADLAKAFQSVKAEMGKVIIGQDHVVDQLLTAIFAQGHCLIEGVPGLAKTLMISTLAQSMHMSFKRIQFTPDLMPSDITGTEVIQEDKATGQRAARFLKGPIFANVVLADEINRTPPKTQAAMLEAMQEKRVTVAGNEYKLPAPFFVLATQNPIEQEGTYPLPEAQQDRFMFKVFIGYPKYDEEYRIAEATTGDVKTALTRVLSEEQIIQMHSLVRRVPAAPHVLNYALRLTRATRVHESEAPDFVKEWVSWGAGPRGVQYLILGAKSRAALHGRTFATTADVRAVAHPVLRHRVVTNFHAESEGVNADKVIDKLLATIPEPGPNEKIPEAAAAAFR